MYVCKLALCICRLPTVPTIPMLLHPDTFNTPEQLVVVLVHCTLVKEPYIFAKKPFTFKSNVWRWLRITHTNTYTNCNTSPAGCSSHTLQHTATHCKTLQHNVKHCNTLQHTTVHCNTLQHTAETRGFNTSPIDSSHHTLQQAVTHYNTLQRTVETNGFNTSPAGCNPRSCMTLHRSCCALVRSLADAEWVCE